MQLQHFQADNPFTPMARTSLDYDILIEPVLNSARDLISRRSACLLARCVGLSSWHAALGQESECVEEIHQIVSCIRVPDRRRHEHHHLKMAVLQLAATNDPEDVSSFDDELRALRTAWEHLRRAEVVPGALVDLSQCCGNLRLGASLRKGAS